MITYTGQENENVVRFQRGANYYCVDHEGKVGNKIKTRQPINFPLLPSYSIKAYIVQARDGMTWRVIRVIDPNNCEVVMRTNSLTAARACAVLL